MATIVLGAAGMAVGGAIGGSVLGLGSTVIGRAVGASIGRAIDQRLLGSGSEPVETGRVDRLRLTGAGEGAPVGHVWGRMRIGGQVIWASRFREHRDRSGGGKGAPRRPETVRYSYSVNLAVALCEGEIARVGRVWADGEPLAAEAVTMRVYRGTRDQQPDPKMEAVEGAGNVPAYRGTAYVVFEDLALGTFGNRVPQFTFEVFRPSQPWQNADGPADLAAAVQAVAMIPGSGEYALATSPVTVSAGYGKRQVVNANSPSGRTDFLESVTALEEELPRVGSVSLVVSWFGDDLRAGACTLKPKVERAEEGEGMAWRAGGIGRGAAEAVAQQDGGAVYGGTPADASVVEAIREMTQRGLDCVFYPFILMEQLEGNDLPDPWTGAEGQPALPWRGRITLSAAPGQAGSPDGTGAAEAEVAAFFGSATPEDFSVNGATVSYSGPAEWSYRRFILHYAHLCAAAGGVGAFCIGSEMRALTQIRGENGSFPAVAALRTLASEVRAILGLDCKIGYAADWSEYHGYQPPGTADKLFHLDPLWADDAIDFIGIDNYMPLSDWRDGEDHADAGWGNVHDLDYLRANVAGGEGFDWYYPTQEARDAQRRAPITDALGEPWLWRVKDLVGWWSNPHHDRVGGARAATPSPWVPGSKPIWFTEYGCAAIDRGTNQPNKFLDPKSSESALPYYSAGHRDDEIQTQYIRAVTSHFADPANNPADPASGVRMVDMTRAHAWAWDARPWPAFPNRDALWSDGGNYARGHWLTGRASGRPLASVVEGICAAAGLRAIDTSRLRGLVRGYALNRFGTAREALQPLMLAYGFDAIERDGTLVFRTRDGAGAQDVAEATMLLGDDAETPVIERVRGPVAELPDRVRLTFVEADGDYATLAAEAAQSGEDSHSVSETELPLALTRGEGARLAERWLAEARVARDRVRFALPPSRAGVGAGDVLRLPGAGREGLFRVDRVTQAEGRAIEAVRIEPGVYRPGAERAEDRPSSPAVPAIVPVEALFLDLPLLSGAEMPHAPHAAFVAEPWPGDVALMSAPQDGGYAFDLLAQGAAVVGRTLDPLAAAPAGRIDRGPALRVELVRGALASVTGEAFLSGGNLAVIGDGTPDGWEVFQFREAALLSPGVYALAARLRGQAGSDGVMPQVWPAGSFVVLLDGTPEQIDLSPGTRGVTRHFRWGPAARPLDDPSWRHAVHAFAGNGLRPYPVCHLRARTGPDGARALTWVRRTRIEGDGWHAPDVPLGEEAERYVVRLRAGETLLREETVTAPGWTYTAAAQAADGTAGQAVEIGVAQLSQRFGPGPDRRVMVAP